MKKRKKENGKMKFILLCMGLFLLSVTGGAASKLAVQPLWSKKYTVKWSDKIGTLQENLSYDKGDLNTFDLYLPKDNTLDNYGLVVYLHAGGFTSGDKTGDKDMLSWLCSKGYVAAGINYTLFTETNNASILTQSNEIKQAIPEVINAAEKAGYPIDKLAMAGGSAGHTLAMIYAYRDAKEAPVPVVFTFGAVGPSSFYREDWDNYGFDRDTEESYQGAAGIFSAMLGEMIPTEEIENGSYINRMTPISAVSWITPESPPTVVAYGTHDRIQPFKAALRLESALEENKVDYKFFTLRHSGHGLQNDGAIQKQWMEAIVDYLEKYMPTE
mgnify:CR=1 FL=1